MANWKTIIKDTRRHNNQLLHPLVNRIQSWKLN